jgi:hypothetical protein
MLLSTHGVCNLYGNPTSRELSLGSRSWIRRRAWINEALVVGRVEHHP